jgi:hypothetical protein
MKPLRCLFGRHKYAESLSTWLRVEEIFLLSRRCVRCGKIKEYAFDRKTCEEIRLPQSADEMEDFEPVWKKILARRDR